jgi:hypothetical protein
LGKLDCAGTGGDDGTAASSSTTVRFDGDGGGVDSAVAVRVGIGAFVSFFAETESDFAGGDGSGAVTDAANGGLTGVATGNVPCAATGGTTLLWELDCAGASGGGTAASSSTTMRVVAGAATGVATCTAAGAVTLLLGELDCAGTGGDGGTAASSSTTVRFDGDGGGVDSDVAVRVGIGAFVSFFAETESDFAGGDGSGVVTGAATGAATGRDSLVFGRTISGDAVTAVRSSVVLRLDGGTGAPLEGAATVFSAVG